MPPACSALAYLLRAVGDAGAGASWLTWVSPLGWVEQMRPYAGPAVVAAAVGAAVTVALAAAAAVLAGRRDLGAGLLPAGPGGPAAGWLRSPLALAWRLQRTAWPAGCWLSWWPARCSAPPPTASGPR